MDGDIRYVLIDYTDEHKHPGTMGHVISEDMKFEMCKRVIIEFAKKYERNPDLWSEVMENVGDYYSVDKTLLRARQKVIGNAPKNRND